MEPGGEGGVEEGGEGFYQHEDCDLKHLCAGWWEGCSGQEALDFSLSAG